ncbi:hypothetical protein MRX96_023177 [Rhipicephalus microplus]
MVPPNQSYVGSSNDLNTAYKECRLRDPPSQCALELSLEKLKKRGRLVCIKNSERLLYRKSTLHDHGLYKKSSFRFLWQERLAGSSIRVGETDRTLSISKVGDNQKKGEGGEESNWHSWEHHSTAHTYIHSLTSCSTGKNTHPKCRSPSGQR